MISKLILLTILTVSKQLIADEDIVFDISELESDSVRDNFDNYPLVSRDERQSDMCEVSVNFLIAKSLYFNHGILFRMQLNWRRSDWWMVRSTARYQFLMFNTPLLSTRRRVELSWRKHSGLSDEFCRILLIKLFQTTIKLL